MNFRNVEFADVPLEATSVWIYGANAQGKTALLEALGLLCAARSFRTQKSESMVRFGQKSASLLFGLKCENIGECEVSMEFGAGRKIFADGGEIEKLGDFIGRFPALSMCSDDIRILRGSPENRRRDLDIFISSLDPIYFSELRKYHAALAQRNALLKDCANAASLFEPFERQMAQAGEIVWQKRSARLRELAAIASEKYSLLAGGNGESAQIKMKSSCDIPDADAFMERLAADRAEDFERRYTRRGPHRDDFAISVAGVDAKLYASEGQQRSAVLAVKLAQFELFKNTSGIQPVILCDDILGELDTSRRAAFWSCIDPSAQVVATSTSPAPTDGERHDWKIIEVAAGKFFEK